MEDLTKLTNYLLVCSNKELSDYAIKVRNKEYETISTDRIAWYRWDAIGSQVRSEIRKRAEDCTAENLIDMLKA